MDFQLSDPDLKKLMTLITTGTTPSQKDLFLCSPAVKYFFLTGSICPTKITYYGTLGVMEWKVGK